MEATSFFIRKASCICCLDEQGKNPLSSACMPCPEAGLDQSCFEPTLNYPIKLMVNHMTKTFLKGGDRPSTDWDKAWSSFRKKGKKSLFSQFKPQKYVSWNPPRSEYPLSEEVDPIKRTERSNLRLWTSPKFTLVGAIVVVSMLLIYTLIIPPK